MPEQETMPIWWVEKRQRLLDLATQHLNAYVYDADTIVRSARRLLELQSVDRVLFAMKSNFNADILRLLAECGVDFECVSPEEVTHLLSSVPALGKERILFTPNFAPRSDYAWAREEGIRVTLDNLFPLQAWPELFADQDLFVRIDPGIGRGHHDHVVTAGEHSKFGIPLFEVDELEALVQSAGARVTGIHAHSGSGIPEADTWGLVAEVLSKVANRFPDATVLDLGGGIGVPARPDELPFDLLAMDATLLGVKRKYPGRSIWIEPGRFLVAEAGVLLAHVTQLKGKGERRYVGLSTGMNALLRPSLYDAYHEIVNLTKLGEPVTQSVTVVGPICESGDTLGRDRPMPDCESGDVALIANAGAYGRVMASQYNLRPIPGELVLSREH